MKGYKINRRIHVLGFGFLTLEPGTTISLLYICTINRENRIISQACLHSSIFQMTLLGHRPIKVDSRTLLKFVALLSELGFQHGMDSLGFPQALGTTSQLLPHIYTHTLSSLTHTRHVTYN